jgi:hypothetical protein
MPEQSKEVRLECDSCGATEVRPRHNLLTGHVFDMALTYICVTCRGDMREVSDDS